VGKFMYDGLVKVDFEDRLLLHVQTVIGSKLRRGEPFYFTWRDDSSLGNGRTTVWVHPRCSLVYKYYGSRRPNLNPAWIEVLAYTANSPAGLHVVPEPQGPGEADPTSTSGRTPESISHSSPSTFPGSAPAPGTPSTEQ
jgi:hypothetical protein